MIPTKAELVAAITKTEKLVPAPRTLAQASRLLRDPQSDLTDISMLISQDSALAVDVLRCANSAYYCNAEPVSAIGQAVQIIGFRETIRLLNLVAAHQTASRDLGCYGIAAEDFWAESLCNGLFLEELGLHTKAYDSGEAYTAGLLRFVGRLAINQAVLSLGGGLFWDGQSDIGLWEMENVGIRQAQAGAELLSRWGFPESVVNAIRGQDDDITSSDTGLLALAMNYSAQLLPAGCNAAFASSLDQQTLTLRVDHPFVMSTGLSESLLNSVQFKTADKMRTILDKLYR